MFEANESDVLTVKPYDRFILPKQNLGIKKDEIHKKMK